MPVIIVITPTICKPMRNRTLEDISTTINSFNLLTIQLPVIDISVAANNTYKSVQICVYFPITIVSFLKIGSPDYQKVQSSSGISHKLPFQIRRAGKDLP